MYSLKPGLVVTRCSGFLEACPHLSRILLLSVFCHHEYNIKWNWLFKQGNKISFPSLLSCQGFNFCFKWWFICCASRAGFSKAEALFPLLHTGELPGINWCYQKEQGLVLNDQLQKMMGCPDPLYVCRNETFEMRLLTPLTHSQATPAQPSDLYLGAGSCKGTTPGAIWKVGSFTTRKGLMFLHW